MVRGVVLTSAVVRVGLCPGALIACARPQGACIGAGVDMVSACDIRYCTEDAFFTIKEVRVVACSVLPSARAGGVAFWLWSAGTPSGIDVLFAVSVLLTSLLLLCCCSRWRCGPNVVILAGWDRLTLD